ncbi:MAG: hypothetical protein M9951_13365 [Burkholderiaceae bacterium]|nr:hypothetical protein [Burkholderiaceae bacterium]
MTAYEKGEDFPIPKLDFFMELFDRLFEPSSGVERRLISWLNETRNGLIHFNTDIYSIERASMVDGMNAAVAAMIETPTRSKGVFFYEEWQSERFSSLCDSIRVRLQKLADA